MDLDSGDLLSRILADWDDSTASRARTSSTPRRITSAIRIAVFRRGPLLGVSAVTRDVVLDAITQHLAR